jgi:hypothetical protein
MTHLQKTYLPFHDDAVSQAMFWEQFSQRIFPLFLHLLIHSILQTHPASQ